MKVFLVLSEFPDPQGEAVEVVAFEVLRHLITNDHEVVLQVIWRYPADEIELLRREKNIEHIDQKKLEICSVLSTVDTRCDLYHRLRRFVVQRFVSIIFPEKLFPAAQLVSQIKERVLLTQADRKSVV